jgi:hypothetical protein
MTSGKRHIGDPLERAATTGKIGGRKVPSLPTERSIAESPNTQTPGSSENQPPEHSNIQKSESLNIQTSKSSNVQTPENSATQTPEYPHVQTSGSLDFQTSKRPNIQPSKSSDVQTPRNVETQTFERPEGQMAKQKGSPTSPHRGREQQTIYLPPHLVRKLKIHKALHDKEYSDIVAEALEDYFRVHQE